MNVIQIIVLAIIQGLAELLPVSSSAHVIAAEKLMGLDPAAPEMTFLLVMLHTGTMFAVLFYFWPRWRTYIGMQFLKMIVVATTFTGILGFGLKIALEKVIMPALTGRSAHEVEDLFRNLPMIALALFLVGILILWASGKDTGSGKSKIDTKDAFWIGIVQGLCLPFRGFSRSGTTISTAMFRGISRPLAEDFSFALAVVLTPPVILLQLKRLMKSSDVSLSTLLMPGAMGMVFSFIAGLVALRWLSAWLEKGRWRYFGYYCLLASIGMLALHQYLSV